MREMARVDIADGSAGLLERSEQLKVLSETLAGVAGSSRGRVALVAGEAGIGKTALLRRFCADVDGSARVLWAGCEPLFTPRPLGPVLDLAVMIGGEVAARAADGARPFDVAAALLRELRSAGPSVLVLEDVHWADEATLDVVRLAGRRVADVPVLLVLSWRDDELGPSHPLRIVLGDLPGSDLVTRLELAGLSPQADAVLGRAARLGEQARVVLDAAAVVPGTAERWLLEALAPAAGAGGLDECLGSGMVVLTNGRVQFRHEIARQVVEESLPPGRRAGLHRAALAALAGQAAPDLARLAHHAEAAGDADAVLRFAPAAAERAAAAGARREAAGQYARALRFADALEPAERAGLLERFAGVAFYTGMGTEATAALREAVEIHQARGDLLRQGDALRLLAGRLAADGALAEARAALSEAVAGLEQLPPGPELARTYNAMAALLGVVGDDEAVGWAERALELAERVGCLDAIGDTLNIVGMTELGRGDLDGLVKLDRSRELAEQAGDELGVVRAYMHPALALAVRREWVLAERYIQPGLTFCRERGLEGWEAWLTTLAAEAALAQGRWDEVVSAVAMILAWPAGGFIDFRVNALVMSARVRARRGEPGYWPLLDEAAQAIKAAPAVLAALLIAAARAEAAWLEGAPGRRMSEE